MNAHSFVTAPFMYTEKKKLSISEQKENCILQILILIVIFSMSTLTSNMVSYLGKSNISFLPLIFQKPLYSCALNQSGVELNIQYSSYKNKSEIKILPKSFISFITTGSNGRVGNILSAYSSLMVSS